MTDYTPSLVVFAWENGSQTAPSLGGWQSRYDKELRYRTKLNAFKFSGILSMTSGFSTRENPLTSAFISSNSSTVTSARFLVNKVGNSYISLTLELL